MNPRPVSLTIAALALLPLAASCGGGSPVAKTAMEQPHAALPSGAKLVAGFRPGAIVADPMVVRFREAVGQQDADLPFLGPLRLWGLDPQRDVEAGAWGLYDFAGGVLSWGIALAGDIEEEAFLAEAARRIGAGPDGAQSKTYLRERYHVLTGRAGPRGPRLHVAFPGPGFLLASNNEAILQKSLAVWRGKADAMSGDPQLGSMITAADTAAPAWVVGLAAGTLNHLRMTAGLYARGDSLGQGVRAYQGVLRLEPERVSAEARFECDNAASAEKQSANYQELIKEFARARIQEGWGLAALELLNKTRTEADGPLVRIAFDLGQTSLTEIAEQLSEARAAMGQRVTLEDYLRRHSAAPAGLPADEPFEEPLEPFSESDALPPPETLPLPDSAQPDEAPDAAPLLP